MNIMGAYATTDAASADRSKSAERKYEPETSVRHPKALKKSEDAAIFPKVQAPTYEIPALGCDGSPFEGPDNVTARKGLECEESLSLTPSHASHSRSKKWTLTPKDTSAVRKPPVENENTTSPEFFSNHEGRKKTVSRAAREDAKLNLEAEIQRHIADAECMLSEDFHKLEVALSQAQIKINALTEENTELKAELNAHMDELSNMALAYEDQTNRANELEEHLALLEQQIKDPSKIQSLRGQVLENAKTEIAQLRIHLKDRDKRIMELEKVVSKREMEQRAEGNGTFKQLNDMCCEIQRYKILLSGAARQTQQLQEAFNANQSNIKTVQAQWDSNSKELAASLKTTENDKRKLESALKEAKGALEKERKTNEGLENALRELRQKYEKAFTELNEAKEEIEQLGGGAEGKSGAAPEYSEQLTQMKEQFGKKLQTVNDELAKAKEAISKKDAMLAEYEKKMQEDPLMDIIGERAEDEPKPDTAAASVSELNNIKNLLEIPENEPLQPKIEELLSESEEYKLVKAQHERMEEAIKESQKTIADLNAQLAEERNRWAQVQAIETSGQEKAVLEQKVAELQTSFDQLQKAKTAIQTQLNNLSETIKVKDQEISMLQQSRDLAEKAEKEAREALDTRVAEHQELVNAVKEYSAAFSFIEPGEAAAENLIDSLKKIKQKSAESLAQIDSLKKQLADLSSENERGRAAEHSLAELKGTIEKMGAEKAELVEKIAELEKQIAATSMQQKTAETGEQQKLKKMLNEERVHNTEVLEQMKEMHKTELEAAASGKQIVINQLENKVKGLEEKVKRKKEKLVQKLNEFEDTLKKYEDLLVENQRLQAGTKKLEKAHLEKCTEFDMVSSKLAKAEDRAKKDKESLEASLSDMQKSLGDVQSELATKDETIQKLKEDLDSASRSLKKPKVTSTWIQTDTAPDIAKEEAKKLTERVQELTQKLEAAEKAGKVSQQRLLQLHEENTGKINDLQEKLKKSAAQCKSAEAEKNELAAECKRLQELCDEAKTDMKKMMATTKKMSTVRSSLSEGTFSVRSSVAIPSVPKVVTAHIGVMTEPNKEWEQLVMNYEDQIAKLSTRPDDLLKALDSLIAGQAVDDKAIESQLNSRIEKIKAATEEKYAKELENIQKQIPQLALVKTSSGGKSLQESIEHLKESLTESEKMVEENVQKRIVAERRRIREEIKKTMGTMEDPKSVRTSGSRKDHLSKAVTSPARMSALEQQYKCELDIMNNEDICCATGRTVSFGVPEFEADLAEDYSGINSILEECKKKLEQQKTEELDKVLHEKSIQHQAELGKLKADIEKLQGELQAALKKAQDAHKKHSQETEELKKSHAENVARIEAEKDKERDELLRLKETELTKAINSKKDELTRQYMENKEAMVRDFENLRQKLYSEVEAKTAKIEKEYQELLGETERLKNEAENKYADRTQEKEKLMDNILKMRIKEVEDEYRIKSEKLEYELKYEAQCQTERQRAEMTGEQKELETKYKAKIEDLENRIRSLGSENRRKAEALENELKNAREEAEQKLEQARKRADKEWQAKTDQLQKKLRDADEKTVKARKELEEIVRRTEDEKETATEGLAKKHKEELRMVKEKHKAELRSLKESHKNELIKKNIEKDREIKKLNESHAAELEQLSKQTESRKEIIIKPVTTEDKKETEKILQQKIAVLRRKLENEYQEKEKTLRAEIDKKSKELADETVKKLEGTMTLKFQSQLKSELEKLKKKYQEKKAKLEELRAEYETRLRTEMKENRMRESNSGIISSAAKGRPDMTLSEIDCEGLAKENEEKVKAESVRKRLVEEYEGKLQKMGAELATATSRKDGKVLDALQTFVDILILELDKLLKFAAGPKAVTGTTMSEINHTIAKMVLRVTPDGKCREYLESFKVKLNSVLFAFKHSLEEQYAKQYTLGSATTKLPTLSTAERETLDHKMEGSDVKKYFEVMDEGYEKNILNKISPIRNANGKYVVDVEKVVRDLLLVKEALYSVFQKSGTKMLEGTSCTILEELGKIQQTEGGAAQQNEVLDNIAKHYRILLNTILRFAVEAAWVVKEEAKGGSKKKPVDTENEELLRLKLMNAELTEKLADAEQEIFEHRKRLALFVGDDVSVCSH